MTIRKSVSSVVAQLILAGVFALTASSAYAQTNAGSVSALLGQVSIQRGAATLTPTVGTAVDQGDRITTGPASSIAITLTDRSQLELNESSTEVIDEHATSPSGKIRTQVSLFSGVVRSFVDLTAGTTESFEVRTPNAVTAARGTRWDTGYTDTSARPGYPPSCHQFTDVSVYEGTVDVEHRRSPCRSAGRIRDHGRLRGYASPSRSLGNFGQFPWLDARTCRCATASASTTRGTPSTSATTSTPTTRLT